ncbi:MAG: hypothetical protein ACI4SB_00115, partial [Acutalibacteraceae bacterium]
DLNGKYRDFFLNPPPNPDDYKPIREKLISQIEDFVKTAQAETRKASELVRTDYTDLDVMQWQNSKMKFTMYNYLLESHVDLREMSDLRRQLSRLESNVAALKKCGNISEAADLLNKYTELGSYEELRKMKEEHESKSVRFILKLRRLYGKFIRLFRRNQD